MTAATLIAPSLDRLPHYVAALERGWSPDNARTAEVATEQLNKIAEDAAGFIASLDDREPRGASVRLPDGSVVPRLPCFSRWIWDGEFCGAISLRWQRGTSALPANVLGHIGFAVVPWKRRAGCAKQALALLLPEAKAQGLAYVELTTDPDNLASSRVILACGGKVMERFVKPKAYGSGEGLRFRIDLSEPGERLNGPAEMISRTDEDR
jgi:predicted acetyltransferase